MKLCNNCNIFMVDYPSIPLLDTNLGETSPYGLEVVYKNVLCSTFHESHKTGYNPNIN